MKNECESYSKIDNGIKSIVSGSIFCVGDCVKAFNNKEWEKIGDIGDNKQFYREAIIVKLRKQDSMIYADRWWVADVKWKHTGEISNGHFVCGLKHCHTYPVAPKLNLDNTISIALVKDKFTREEVIELLYKMNQSVPDLYSIMSDKEFDKWIKDNLK